jgi:glycosyltransferase involved in cell wall biosynthesis
MAEKVRSLGVGKNRYAIIQNWADGRFVKPIPREHNRLRRLWGLEDAFVVGYSGNLGRAHEIQTFLSAIESLESGSIAPGSAAPSAPNILWLFTGGGALMNQLKQEVRRRQLLSVIFRPYQPQETLCESLSLPDVHLVSLRPELEGLIVPSKFYGIAAAGRPVIFVGDPDGEVARLIRTYRSGFSVREEDGAGLADAVMTLIENPELAAELGCRARESFQAELDFRYALKRWEDLILKSHATVGGAGL